MEELQDAKPGDVLVTKIKHRVRHNDRGSMTTDIIGIVLPEGASEPVTKPGKSGDGVLTAIQLSDEKEFEESK